MFEAPPRVEQRDSRFQSIDAVGDRLSGLRVKLRIIPGLFDPGTRDRVGGCGSSLFKHGLRIGPYIGRMLVVEPRHEFGWDVAEERVHQHGLRRVKTRLGKRRAFPPARALIDEGFAWRSTMRPKSSGAGRGEPFVFKS
jgi:hypothetical protein